MGLIKIIRKIFNSGYIYEVNKNILVEYINREIKFSKENGLELIAEFYIYDDRKYHIILLNEKSIIACYCNEKRYANMEQFMVEVVNMFSDNIKLELPYTDDVFLNCNQIGKTTL